MAYSPSLAFEGGRLRGIGKPRFHVRLPISLDLYQGTRR